MSTRQATPGPSGTSGISTSRKRTSSEVLSEADVSVFKKLKAEPLVVTQNDKKKRKKKKKKTIPITGPRLNLKPTIVPRITPPAKSFDRNERIAVIPSLDTPNTIQAAPVPNPDDVIEKLNAEIASKSTASPYFLIDKHENAMSQIQQNITCQICLDLLYKPFAIAPCGHIACYSCLMSWFSRSTDEQAADQLPVYYRKKTCPHCRATVREPPVEVWAIKNIVNSLIGTGLLDGISAPIDKPTETEPPKDELWKNVFRPLPSLADREEVGIFDEEDGGVYRCIDCTHEIANGECTHCHRVYAGHDLFELDYDSEDDLGQVMNVFLPPVFGEVFDDEEDYFEEEEYHHGWWAGNGIDVFSGSEDEDGSGSLDGFIDDGDVHHLEVEDHLDLDSDGVDASTLSQGPTQIIEVFDDDEDETVLPSRSTRARRAINVISDDDDDSDGSGGQAEEDEDGNDFAANDINEIYFEDDDDPGPAEFTYSDDYLEDDDLY
ncbi:hypothetical protein BDP27DRAFT_1356380 [Rhodocollybia butyracea]|uniref:RING-type domain-containing protein n=1 Tax=Rhodocollybia butyracea TaxID=206335 RepID=A0A9P5UGK8_9AGAR|nr:hypothetical protein BDP27DRAFT_1356380 [Rhodocollybia butyracea]